MDPIDQTVVEISPMASEEKSDRGPEMSIRALAAGVSVGGLIAAMNMYMGLKIGITEGGAILSAILCYALVRGFGGHLTILENNIGQTVSTGAASLGVMVSVIPALIMLGQPMGLLTTMVWLFLVSIIGVLFAVPLRKQFVVMDALPFPTGTACAATIRAMHARGETAIRQARTFGISGLAAGVITWFRDGIPKIIPEISMAPFAIGGVPAARLLLGVSWSPVLLGAGMLVGLRIGFSLLLGGIAGWAILGPVLYHAGVIENPGMRQISHWTMWLAIPLMVSAGFISLITKWRTFGQTFRSMRNAGKAKVEGGEVPFTVWAWATCIAALATAAVMQFMLGIPFWMSILALVLSFLLAAVAVRAYGETDVSPVGTMGHTTQIVFGALAPGQILPNLMTAGITAGCANTSVDMMQDLKAGYLLGSTPWKQVAAQSIGVLVGSLVAVPVFNLLVGAYGLGSEALPAPAAVLWSGMAKLLSQGLSTLPPYAGYAIGAGTLLGVLLGLPSGKWKKFIPSALGMGIGIVIPVAYTSIIFIGSVVSDILARFSPKWSEDSSVYVASGLIAGEALLAVVVAVLGAAGVI